MFKIRSNETKEINYTTETILNTKLETSKPRKIKDEKWRTK